MFNNLSRPTGWTEHYRFEFQMPNDYDHSTARTCVMVFVYKGLTNGTSHYHYLSGNLSKFYLAPEVISSRGNTSVDYPHPLEDFDLKRLKTFNLFYKSDEGYDLWVRQIRIRRIKNGRADPHETFCANFTKSYQKDFCLKNNAWTILYKDNCRYFG